MKKLVILIVCLFILTACSQQPSVDVIQTAIAQTSLAQPSPTSTIEPSVTPTPVPTNTPTITPSPTFTQTASLTPTQIVGSIKNPLKIGDLIILDAVPKQYLKAGATNPAVMELELKDMKREEEAKKLAKKYLDWGTYIEPANDQEYLCVYVRIKIVETDHMNETETIYPYWSLTLRYTNAGNDVWSSNPIAKFGEGYPPLEGEGWVFFLIRKNSEPFLYFQPYLMMSEQVGYRKSGAYFDLSVK